MLLSLGREQQHPPGRTKWQSCAATGQLEASFLKQEMRVALSCGLRYRPLNSSDMVFRSYGSHMSEPEGPSLTTSRALLV
jgi:hypothetical protein